MSDNPFSQAQTRLIMICFKHMRGVPDVDWNAVATEYGYKNGPLARSKFAAAMSACRKKMEGTPTTPAGSSAGNTPTAAAGSAKKGGTKRKADGPDDTPSKRPKTGSQSHVLEDSPIKQEVQDNIFQGSSIMKVEEDINLNGGV